jgi:hypothetical protein
MTRDIAVVRARRISDAEIDREESGAEFPDEPSIAQARDEAFE